MDDVVCKCVYLKNNPEPEKQERRPHDPNAFFKPGEFAALMQKSLETIDLIFLDGLDWKAFFQSFQQLQEKYQADNPSIQAIERKSDGAFVIRLEVDAQANRAEIELDIKNFYETQMKVLEAQYEERLKLQGAHLEDARKYLEVERQEKATLYGVMKTMADNQGTNYNISNANIGNIVDKAESGSRQQVIQHNYASPEKQSLVEAAAEIQALLQQLEQINPTATQEEQKAFVNAAIPPTRRDRILGAVQAGGIAVLEETQYGKIIKAIIEGWRKPS